MYEVQDFVLSPRAETSVECPKAGAKSREPESRGQKPWRLGMIAVSEGRGEEVTATSAESKKPPPPRRLGPSAECPNAQTVLECPSPKVQHPVLRVHKPGLRVESPKARTQCQLPNDRGLLTSARRLIDECPKA